MTNQQIEELEKMPPGPLVYLALQEIIAELREERKTCIHRGLVVDDRKLEIERLKGLLRECLSALNKYLDGNERFVDSKAEADLVDRIDKIVGEG